MGAAPKSHISCAPVIRSAQCSDLPAVLGLVDSLTPNHQSDDAAMHVDRFARILAQPLRRVLVAEVAGTVVGTLDVVVAQSLSRGGRSWAVLEHLAVAAPHRGNGIGSALVGAAVAFAQDAECYKIQVVSGSERSQAHDVFEGHGFGENARGFRRFLDHSVDP